MDRKPEEFLKRLRATFRVEAAEHLRALGAGLVELESPKSAGTHQEVLETVFREVHSMKGAARAVDAAAIEAVCHSLESLFSAWKRQEVAPSMALFDLLHRTVDTLETLLASLDESPRKPEALIQSLETARRAGPPPRAGQSAPPRAGGVAPPAVTESTPTIAAPPAAASAPAGVASPPAGALPAAASPAARTAASRAATDTIRMPAARLDSLLLEAEELIATKLSAARRAAEARELKSNVAPWKKKRAQLRAQFRLLDQSRSQRLHEIQEEEDTFFTSVESRLAALESATERDRRSLERVVNQLLESLKSVVMLPASTILDGFPKLVRDLARDGDKLIDLEVEGGEIEIDRRILEAMKEPLLHLVRNCVDHGIEVPRERELLDKPRAGKIGIRIHRRDSDKAEVVVSDDGAGIPAGDVREAALKQGIVTAENLQRMDEREILDLVFQSGVSTSPIITDLSGRGLGLAIVRDKVEKLGGTISLETKAGVGTTFRILLPLTRATFRGVLVRVDHHLFVLPTTQVERVFSFRRGDVKTVENRETLPVQGRPVSLVRLRDALELPVRPGASIDPESGRAVLLGPPDRRIAFEVDEVLHEQEVLVKNLGKQLAGLRDIAGATVLETGKVVPVLNVTQLLKSALRVSHSPARQQSRAAERPAPKSILVAEDSITSRMLLKNILESAGYLVQTAVDGAEAFSTLRTAPFDLVISDVDMPRMNGFDLAAKIRADKKFAELPVVLVTSLESREDRERGVDAGANAYIVKSSFDQSNLLEVLRRLL